MTFDLNKTDTWIADEIFRVPPFDFESYQKKIDAICGLNSLGKPNVIATWMPAVENWTPYYTSWTQSDSGFGIDLILRSQYVAQTLEDEDGNVIDVPPPRFALKQWLAGAQYAASEEKSRWLVRRDGFQVHVRENRPPHPKEGRYIPLISIGLHNAWCCKAAKKENVTCWGDYRLPDEAYLTWLQKAVDIRNRTSTQDTNQALTQKTLMEAAKETVLEQNAKKERAELATDSLITENLPEMLELVTGERLRDPKAFSLPSILNK